MLSTVLFLCQKRGGFVELQNEMPFRLGVFTNSRLACIVDLSINLWSFSKIRHVVTANVNDVDK